VTDVRRSLLVSLVAGLALLVHPAVGRAEEGGFHGFVAFDTHAQGQVATVLGFMGDLAEEDRLGGALADINGPPAGSRDIAAFVQRGAAATYTYGVLGGPGGAAGVLPQPPPGEADAFYPAGPLETTFSGPLTGAAGGAVIDGRVHAAAAEEPTGLAEVAVNRVDVPGGFRVGQSQVTSRSEPADGGVMAESLTVLHDIVIGPLHIATMMSRASAFMATAGGPPKAVARTVVVGATVNGNPVEITDQGVVAGSGTAPGAQTEVNKALAQAGLSDVRLTPSSVVPGDDTVEAVTGGLRVVHRDPKFGARYLQGIDGGGFTIGGAEARVLVRR
jgi:hypothetical protein